MARRGFSWQRQRKTPGPGTGCNPSNSTSVSHLLALEISQLAGGQPRVSCELAAKDRYQLPLYLETIRAKKGRFDFDYRGPANRHLSCP
jgi:hypothetical protein